MNNPRHRSSRWYHRSTADFTFRLCLLCPPHVLRACRHELRPNLTPQVLSASVLLCVDICYTHNLFTRQGSMIESFSRRSSGSSTRPRQKPPTLQHSTSQRSDLSNVSLPTFNRKNDENYQTPDGTSVSYYTKTKTEQKKTAREARVPSLQKN